MLNECIYSADCKTIYNRDFILRIPRPLIFKKYVVIIHNTAYMGEHDFYYRIIEENLIDYKNIYTSEPKKINYYNIKSLDQVVFNSTYDISNIGQIIDIVCTQKDILYTVIVVNDGLVKINYSANSNVHIIDINPLNYKNVVIDLSYSIQIYNTNILQIQDKKYQFDSNTSDLLIFLTQKYTKQFINWIEYNFIDFPKITFYIELKFLSKPDLLAQFICLRDVISETTLVNFPDIRKRFLHSLNYFNTFVSITNKLELGDSVISCNTFFNICQNNIMEQQLELSNPLDKLFLKAFSITPNYLTSKQSKTYISNRIKINKSIKLLDQIPNISHLESDNIFQASQEQYTSPISLSNWYDEYTSNQCLGILIRVESTYVDRMGWSCETLNVQTTNTLISREQIYDGHEFFWEKNSRLDNGKMNTSLISGSAIGSGNSLIPLYINKYHWEITLKYVEELVSIAITQNPYLFKPAMYGLYAHVLLNLMSETIKDPTFIKIRFLIQLIITINSLAPIECNRTSDNYCAKTYIANTFIKWIKSQEIFDQKTRFRIYEEIIKNNMRKEYKTKNDIKNLDIIDIFNLSICKENMKEFENLCIFISLINPNDIFKIIDSIDHTFGYIEDKQISHIKENLKSNVRSFNTDNMFMHTSECVFRYEQIKCFAYQCFLTRTQKLKSRLSQTYGLIDFTNKFLTKKILLEKISQYEKILL